MSTALPLTSEFSKIFLQLTQIGGRFYVADSTGLAWHGVSENGSPRGALKVWQKLSAFFYRSTHKLPVLVATSSVWKIAPLRMCYD